MAQLVVENHAEGSKDAQRRARLLEFGRDAPTLLAKSVQLLPLSDTELMICSGRAGIDPKTSHLIYPTGASQTLYTTSLYPTISPRQLPIPPCTRLTTSSNGEYTTVFQDNNNGVGGNIVTYNTAQLLAPYVRISAPPTPLTSVSLLERVLSIYHLNPPPPPISQDLPPQDIQLPLILILTTTQIVLSTPNGTVQGSLESRCYSRVGDLIRIPGNNSGYEYRKGWIGGVHDGDEGVRAGLESVRGIHIVRVEVGFDGDGQYCRSLPRLFRLESFKPIHPSLE
jgi:hypothetical protein